MVVAFDLDGTLLDSMNELEALAVSHIFENYPLSVESARSLYRSTVGMPFRRQLESSALANHAANPEVARRFERDKERIYAGFPLFPEVQGVLASLEHQSIDTAIVSSTRKRLVREIAERFQLPCQTYGYDGRRQWDKIQQLENLKLMYDDVIFVGDSMRDALYAEAAGARFIGIIRGVWSQFALKDYLIIENLYDVMKYL